MTTAAPAAPPWWIDRLRAQLYRALAPWLSHLYADRARRVVWLGVFSMCVSFTLTVTAPLWLLALGPVLLGVPHLLADARYLVVQPGLHRLGPLVWVAALPLAAAGFGAPPVVPLLAMVPLALAAGGGRLRTALVLTAWAALSALALRFENGFLLAFLHLHNVVALGWWWALRPRERRAWLVPAVALLGTGALLLGAAEPLLGLLRAWHAPASGTSFEEFVTATAPFLEAPWNVRLVLSFAFLQSVHYGVWLRLVPDDARGRPAPRPFRHTWQALGRDLGRPVLWGFVAVSLAIAAWAAVDLAAARWGYLRLAAFHGYLELAVAAHFLAKGARPPC